MIQSATHPDGPPNRLHVSGAPRVSPEPIAEASQQANMNLDLRQNFGPASYTEEGSSWARHDDRIVATNPSWMPKGMTRFPTKYAVPTDLKEQMAYRAQLTEAGEGKVTRVLDVQKELDYMKYMNDMSDLARFDNYVEALVDPKQPGSADFLFKVYPEYVNRRMAQAQSDYEFALRNQMIDMWGINTFDDLYFKYMVDQGQLTGPKLTRPTGAENADDAYSSFLFSPYFSKRQLETNSLKLPFSSSTIGSRASNLPISRSGNGGADGKRSERLNMFPSSLSGLTTKDAITKTFFQPGEMATANGGSSAKTYPNGIGADSSAAGTASYRPPYV